MALTATNTYLMSGINALFGWEAKFESVQIAASTTLTQGTVLGELTAADDTQAISITGSPTGGTFTLTFTNAAGDTFTTAAINYNASASNVQTALVALTPIGSSANLGVSGGSLPATPVTLTFQGTLANQPITALTANLAALTGGSPVFVNTHTRGINTGTYKAYASGNSDGSQVPKGILQYDVITDANQNITFGTATGGGQWQETYLSCPMFVAGTFSCADLTGLDATAVTDLGRLLEGTTTAGQFRMP